MFVKRPPVTSEIQLLMDVHVLISEDLCSDNQLMHRYRYRAR
jgi:hypothetical protein